MSSPGLYSSLEILLKNHLEVSTGLLMSLL